MSDDEPETEEQLDTEEHVAAVLTVCSGCGHGYLDRPAACTVCGLPFG